MSSVELHLNDDALDRLADAIADRLADRLAPPPSPDDARALTTEQAAARLGQSPKTVRELARRGELQASRLGQRYRIAPAAIDAYLARHRVPLPARPPRGTRAVACDAPSRGGPLADAWQAP